MRACPLIMPGVYACNQDLGNLCLKLGKKGSVLALLQGVKMLCSGLLNFFSSFCLPSKMQAVLYPEAASFLSHLTNCLVVVLTVKSQKKWGVYLHL